MLGRIDVVTIFPDLVEAFLAASIVGSARERGIVGITAHDLRRWSTDRRGGVDDSPYGGGPGMVMKPEPLVTAIEDLGGPKGPDRESRKARVVLLSPQGKVLDQAHLAALCDLEHLVLVCGRYEGVDQRAVDIAIDEEISIGDYVLSGGEIPAMAIVEGIVRLLPGALGNPESAAQDSFGGELLEGPHYTRPPAFRGHSVPEILRSGDHAAIARWRAEKAHERTRERRPDLLPRPGNRRDGHGEEER